MAKECRKRNQSTETKGFGQKEGNIKDVAAKQVQSSGTENTDPRELLLSDSSEEEDSTLKQVVMVCKKDGTHRFCVNYRRLNATTKADQFPIPRTDDLLDQIGKSKYFSTLDLASGYWQIPVHPDFQAKTAFTIPSGLYEFKVMPFGLTNAPAVFQCLMQRVLMGLNPLEGPDMVTVYIDDILVFSRTLDEHLQSVLQRLKQAGLKLNPQKCHFITQEVEYLGHIITPDGLKTNPRLVEAVVNFPTPNNVQQVRQFLGLSSFYRRFIPNFAKIDTP